MSSLSRPRPGRGRLRRAVAGVALAAAACALSACSLPSATGSSGGATTSSRVDVKNLTYAVITHASPGDAFWDRVRSGALRAGKDYGVKVEYANDPDPGKQSALIDQAVAEKVDGIVVSMANPDGLEASIKQAVAARIPVVTINSGIDKWKAFGAITHIGQSEQIAGRAAGDKMRADGMKKAICVIQEAGNVGLEQRCAAAAEGFGGSMSNIQVDGTNDAQVASTIKAKLQADPSIDGVLTLGGQYAIDAVSAVGDARSKAKIATFDLSADVVKQIQAGKIDFAVDQQPYVQGFLGVTTLYLKSINGNDVGGGQPINSGPAFVTKENADQVLTFAEDGTR